MSNTPQKIFLYNPADVIDQQINITHFQNHIKNNEPFTYIRFGDGEFRAILLHEHPDWRESRNWIKNCDNHIYDPDMCRELYECILELPKFKYLTTLYVGLHGTWHQEEIQEFIVTHDLKDKLHWVSMIIPELAIYKDTLLPFLEEVRNKDTLKILIANDTLNPIAVKLNAKHIVIPRVNCYSKIDDIMKTLESDIYSHYNIKNKDSIFEDIPKPIIIVCASMASEAIIYRLLKYNPEGQYIDMGSVFDAMVGIRSRGYTKNDEKYKKIQEVYGSWLRQ